MDIRQLTCFAAIVEEGTITAAAHRLHMTQPPLTARLQALEEELGCTLFERSGRRLRVTEAGRALYRRACTILGLCEAAKDEISQFRSGSAGTLRIGVVSSVGTTLFLRWLGGFRRQHPSVRYDIVSGNTYQLLEQLRAGQVDIALIRTPFSVPDMEVLRLRTESLLAVGQPALLREKSGDSITLAQLAQCPLVLYRRWEQVLLAHFEAAGCTPQIVCRNDDALTTLALARQGFGVGIMPASALEGVEVDALAVCTVQDAGLSSEIAAVCRSVAALPQCAEQCWQALQEQPL